MTFFLFGFAGSLVILAASLRRDDRYQDICVAAGLSVFCIVCAIPQYLTILLHPRTMDWAFYVADSKLLHLDALKTCLWVRATFPHFASFEIWVYYALPLALGIVYAIERNMMVVRTSLIAAIAAYPFYNLFPAAGPLYLFVNGVTLTATPDGPRNCMPSLHFSWGFLLALNVRGRWLRVLAWIFFALTAASTIVSGEHYYIDLVAAVPFCWLVQRLARWQQR